MRAADTTFPDTTRSRSRERLELIVPVALLVVVIARYPNWMARRAPLAQYFNGVYRSRVLARELVIGIANALDGAVGARGHGALPGFLVGWYVVTGFGFLLTCWLLRRYRRAHAPAVGPVELVVAVAMAASATVPTPYDFLSYALIVAAVVAAFSGRTLTTAALVVAAVATRESGLLVIAIIAASCVTSGRVISRSTWEAARRKRPLWAAAVSGIGTYLLLKTTMRQSGTVALLQRVDMKSNLTAHALWAIALAAGMLVAERWVVGRLDAVDRARRRLLWLLALPYIGVVFVGAIWTEAPRLVIPLVIGEALLAMQARRHSSTSLRPA
jgi:hypothetical protein